MGYFRFYSLKVKKFHYDIVKMRVLEKKLQGGGATPPPAWLGLK